MLCSTEGMQPRRTLARFIHSEARGALVLLAATLTAIAWANLAPAAYRQVWGLSLGPATLGATVRDGLMIAFFALIGLEIRRERVEGALRGRAIALPGAMALGGMLAPALLFVAITLPSGLATGWGIPMATDVAFALGALMIIRRRIPAALWSLLLAVAVIDDLGAILVIALAYGGSIMPLPLLGAAASLGALAWISRRHVAWWPVITLGALACALAAWGGVHAPVIGALAALCLPAAWARHPVGQTSRIDGAIARLHNPVSLIILPLFALAAAGISLAWPQEAGIVTVAVALSLPLGKAIGITLGALLARRWVPRPVGVGTRHYLGLGLVAGIGFTVSLLMADLAYAGGALAAAKLGVLIGSAGAALAGLAVLGARRRVPGPARHNG